MSNYQGRRVDKSVINKDIAQNTIQTTIEKVKMENPVRLAGDGMEESSDNRSLSPSGNKNKQKYEVAPALPKTTCNFEFPLSVKRKEPKFVPYEPYKAAITPIISSEENKSAKSKKKNGKKSSLVEEHIPFPLLNNPNISPVIRVLRDHHRNDGGVNANHTVIMTENFQLEREQWEEERSKMEDEIKRLKNSKRDIENQFKVQTQVNAELKKLLVASMGEDMQSRMQFLSEDKARLAQDIAHYSQMLLEEHEELEKLAIQCDVWRSKFLACSLMVDELAGWKALLSRKYEEAKESIQWLLEERETVKKHSISTQQFLKHLQMVFDPAAAITPKRIPEANLITMAYTNHKLADALHYRLLGSSAIKSTLAENLKCDGKTPAEELALKVLSTKEVVAETLNPVDTGERARLKMCRFHSHPIISDIVNHGCRHCSGEIDVV